MEEVDLKADLKALRQILQEMKELLAWQQLKHIEAKQRSISGIRFFDTTSTDLLDKYSSFLSISMQMHHILDKGKTKITKAEQSRVKSELMTMEYQVHYLGSGVRVFWNHNGIVWYIQKEKKGQNQE